MLLLHIPSGPTVADVHFSQEKTFLPFLLTRRSFPAQTERRNLKTPDGNKSIFLMWYVYPCRRVAYLSNVICHTQIQWLKVIMAYFQQYPNVTCFNICIMIPFSEIFFKKWSAHQPRWGAHGSWITEGSEPLSKIVLLLKWTTVLQGEINFRGKGRERIRRGWSEDMKANKNVKLNKTGNYWNNSQIRKNVNPSSVTYKGQPWNRM